ncbi:hypothetical protein [Flavobacterium xueshanense]|nr:hypothetical protein [Flavobacterium xueshanense]
MSIKFLSLELDRINASIFSWTLILSFTENSLHYDLTVEHFT